MMRSTRPAAVMFDMDGVLIQSREVIQETWLRVARDYGIDVREADIHEHIHGRPGSHTLNTLFHGIPKMERLIAKQRVDSLEETADCDLTEGTTCLLEN